MYENLSGDFRDDNYTLHYKMIYKHSGKAIHLATKSEWCKCSFLPLASRIGDINYCCFSKWNIKLLRETCKYKRFAWGYLYQNHQVFLRKCNIIIRRLHFRVMCIIQLIFNNDFYLLRLFYDSCYNDLWYGCTCGNTKAILPLMEIKWYLISHLLLLFLLLLFLPPTLHFPFVFFFFSFFFYSSSSFFSTGFSIFLLRC